MEPHDFLRNSSLNLKYTLHELLQSDLVSIAKYKPMHILNVKKRVKCCLSLFKIALIIF